MAYKYVTGFINEDFFKLVRQGIADASAQLGIEVEFCGTEDDDCEALSRILYDAIEERCEGIAVNFMHPTKLNDALLACQRAGIPVVSFNMDGDSSCRMCTVSQQFFPAGKGLGERLEEKVEAGTSVLFTMHDAGIDALEQRMHGIESVLKERHIKSHVIISGNTPELARDNIVDTLKENPDIKWIFATGQSDTHGAGLASKMMPERKLQVGGFDVCDEILEMIQDGTIEATVDQQPYVQGFYPVMILHQFRTKGITPFDIDTGSAVIDKEKLNQGIS